MLFWPIFGNFGCPVVTLVIFSSNQKDKKIKNPNKLKKFQKISKIQKIKKVQKSQKIPNKKMKNKSK